MSFFFNIDKSFLINYNYFISKIKLANYIGFSVNPIKKLVFG